jgi:mono/diheme cytochrome c family protein
VRLGRAGAGVATLASIAVAASGCGGGGGTTAPKNASPGLKAFDQAGCGSCHTLAAAHATGKVGKKLDGLRLDAATVEHWVRTGGGGMPTFTGQLSDEQITQVAQFVAQSSG